MVDWVRWIERLYKFRGKKRQLHIHSLLRKGKRAREDTHTRKRIKNRCLRFESCECCQTRFYSNEVELECCRCFASWLRAPLYSTTYKPIAQSHSHTHAQLANTHAHTSSEICTHAATRGGIEHCALCHRSRFLGGRYGSVCAPVYVLHVGTNGASSIRATRNATAFQWAWPHPYFMGH